MATITLKRETIPLIKSSLCLRERLLKLKLKAYKERLKEFEERFGMSTSRFLRELNKCNLGDDAYVVEWEYLSEAKQSIKEELSQLQEINIRMEIMNVKFK